MDVEKQFVSRVILHNEVDAALEENMRLDLFEGPSRRVWEWVLGHYTRYAAAPGLDALQFHFPEYTLGAPTEPLAFYAVRLREKYAYNSMLQTFKDGGKMLEANDNPMRVVDFVRGRLRNVENLAARTPDVNWAESHEARFRLYQQVKGKHGIIGIPTPFPLFNLHTGGWQNEDFILVVARQGIGKTWYEVICAHANWHEGFQPMLFSNEMAASQICRRLDAKHFKLPYQDLRFGRLVTETEARWQDAIEAETLKASRLPFWIVAEAGGVSYVASKIEKYRPSVVYIDGLYLMEDDRRAEAQWQRITHVARDLKSLAKEMKIPIVVSTQFSKEGSNANGTADNIAYADIAKEADLIIGLFQSEDQRLNKLMTVKTLKEREGGRFEEEVRWDIDNMDFYEVGDDEGSHAGINETVEGL